MKSCHDASTQGKGEIEGFILPHIVNRPNLKGQIDFFQNMLFHTRPFLLCGLLEKSYLHRILTVKIPPTGKKCIVSIAFHEFKILCREYNKCCHKETCFLYKATWLCVSLKMLNMFSKKMFSYSEKKSCSFNLKCVCNCMHRFLCSSSTRPYKTKTSFVFPIQIFLIK